MLKLMHISKRYQYQKVLDDLSIELPQCGLIAIIGPSGCGKSTLLHIIGGIDQEFQGQILYDGRHVKHHLASYRRKHISFIFQQFHLIAWLSVHQNIILSQFFHAQGKLNHEMIIDEFKDLKIRSLSLGQRQRISYLRAHYQQSDILLCDEPTGSLDPANASQVMKLLKEESKNRLVILVSHDMQLVAKYSDEIYEMKDGKIVNHQILNQVPNMSLTKQKKHKQFFPHLQLSMMSLLSHKSRSLQMAFGLTLSFLCIVLTLTMSRGLEKQINDYIYSLIPASSISFQDNHKKSISLQFANQLSTLPSVSRVQLFLDEYEHLGVGFANERYEESKVLFIGDDSSPYEHLPLKTGKYPLDDHEILLSLSTAKHLSSHEDISSLIGKELYSWYKYENQVKAIRYQIVGITNQSTSLDTIYQRNNAYIHLLKDVYHYDENIVKASLGLIYIQQDFQRSQVIKELSKDYSQYKFVEVGASTTQNVSQTMKQVKIVLFIFSILAIISSLFLIGEVMFLNVFQKKKDLSIMKCFGAKTYDLLKIVFYETLEIVAFSQVMCTIIYYQLLNIVNQLAQNILISDTLVFSFDYQLLVMVFGISYGLVLLSQLPPLLYVFRLNIIDGLKG